METDSNSASRARPKGGVLNRKVKFGFQLASL
jgi:hypothetical protein